MNVFVLRNARLESNAGLLRVIDANIKNNFQVSVISRNREKRNNKNIIKEEYIYQQHIIDNYVIEIDSQRGAGVKNILPLIKYQLILLYTLYQNRKKMDIIHAFDLDTGLVSMLFSKIFQKKFVYHIADVYSDSRMSSQGRLFALIRKIEFFVINHADGTIIANENRKQQIQGSQPKNLTVIHNAPMISPKELEQLRAEQAKVLPTNQPIFAYVGGLTEQRFINEILEFAAAQPTFSLILAGYGPLEDKVAAYAENYENIYFVGELSYHDSLALYAQSDFMFAMYDPQLANHKYSAPNKVYEAMLLNKPIIVAQNSGVDQLVKKEKTGLVTNYDLTDFTEKVTAFVQDQQAIMNIAKNSERAYANYSWDKMIGRLEKLYQNL